MKTIVLTPVRNEEWILEIFIRNSLRFADHAIILDQASTDRSAEIASSFNNVTLIRNQNSVYNEHERQHRLLNEARQRFGRGNVLITLDADELPIFLEPERNVLSQMYAADPGTCFLFEKPAPLRGCDKVIRYRDPFLLGILDDGSQHSGCFIHSPRLPHDPSKKSICIDSAKVLHVCFLRPQVFLSRWRWYAALENLHSTTKFRHRLERYSSDFMSRHIRQFGTEPMPRSWFESESQLFDSLCQITDQDISWYDFELYRIIQEYGSLRFWMDDIWAFDWRGFVEQNRGSRLSATASVPIKPPIPVQWIRRSLVQLFRFSIYFRSKIEDSVAKR